MTTNDIAGLIASQDNENFQQMLNGWNQQISPPYHIPQPPMPTYVDYETLRKTRIAQERDAKDYQQAMTNLSDYISKMHKSPTQALLDELFDPNEKLEFLISLGYRELPNSSYLVKGEPDPEFKRTFTLEEAFLLEMKIKLKNVLLSKQALKFKM